MKGIVLSNGNGYLVQPNGIEFDVIESGVQWAVTCNDYYHFGPAFDTKAEAMVFARSAAVALADGTGGVFGEVRPSADAPAPVEPAKPTGPTPGMRVVMPVDDVTYEGIIYDCQPSRFWVEWTNGAGEYRLNSDFGTVVKADPAPTEPDSKPAGPTPGMRVKIINPSYDDFGEEGKVGKVYPDGVFSVDWDDGKWDSISANDFGKWVGPA